MPKRVAYITVAGLLVMVRYCTAIWITAMKYLEWVAKRLDN